MAKKRGMVVGEGPKYCGRVAVKDLGIPLQGLSPKGTDPSFLKNSLVIH